MKQIWPTYAYSPTTNVLTLTGLNIDRDQLLLVTAADRGRIMYNFADSSVTASAFTSGANTALTLVATTAGLTTTAALVIYYDDQVAGIAGTVTANNSVLSNVLEYDGNNFFLVVGGRTAGGDTDYPINISGTVTIGAGTVTIGAGTAQIGSVTASISGTVPVSISSVTVGNSVTIGNTVTISGTVTANAGDTSFFVSGLDVYAHRSVLYSSSGNGFANDDGAPVDIDNPLPIVSRALQGTAVTTSNFTSTTASTVLANFNAGREVLTIFNEGAGNLHICAGATCTTIAYQVRLSAGDYYEVPNHQTTITHSAVFATAGTARVTQVS